MTRPSDRRAAAPPASSGSGVRLAALRLLGRRDYTTAELGRKLLEKDYPAADVEAVLERLAADGVLDDRRFAAAFIRTASHIKGRGPVRISRELRARGVDRDIIDSLISAVSTGDEVSAIDRILLRRRLPAAPTRADRRRVYQQLLRRGFSSDAILQVLRARGTSTDDD